MAERRTVLMTVTREAGPPSLAEAASQLGIGEDDLNRGFGVVPIDPAKGSYAVEVFEDRLPAGPGGKPRDDTYSNPPIEPFGPRRK